MKELTKTEEKTTIPTTLNTQDDWGDVQVESKDLMLPRLVLQQSGSDLVKDEKAKAGDYISTLTSDIYSKDGKVKLLPFYARQYIRVEKKVGNKFQFHRLDPYTGDIPSIGERQEGSETVKDYHVYEFFCLTEEGGLPVVISFKSTSHKTGKRLFNQMYIANKQLRRAPAHNWIELSSANQESNGNRYKIMDFKLAEESSKENLDECLSWIRTFKSTTVFTSEESNDNSEEVDTSNSRY